MTEEEKERFIHRIMNQFDYYEVEDLSREEQAIRNEYFMKYNTSAQVEPDIAKLESDINELNNTTDYKEYYKTLVKDHINLDDNEQYFDNADNGFEDLGEFYQKVEKNLKDLIELEAKIQRVRGLKTEESEKLDRLNAVVEQTTRDYEEKTHDILLEKEHLLAEASKEEANRLSGIKNMQEQIAKEISKLKASDPNLAKRDELNDELEELNHQKDPYEREINGKSMGDAEYSDLLRKIDDINNELLSIQENNAHNINAISRLERVLKSYQDEEGRAHTEYLSKAEEIENQSKEKLSLFAVEYKKMNEAIQEQKECQDNVNAYNKELEETETAHKALQDEKVRLEEEKGDISKACHDRILSEHKQELSKLKDYKKILVKLENKEYNKTPDNIIKSLDIVKEAYQSYHSHHNWFMRMFKNWPKTAVGKDYLAYQSVRDKFMKITKIPQENIDKYLDHGQYTGILAEKKNEMDAERNVLNAEERVPYEIKDHELNGNAAPEIKSALHEEGPQNKIDHNELNL